jgi:transposase
LTGTGSPRLGVLVAVGDRLVTGGLGGGPRGFGGLKADKKDVCALLRNCEISAFGVSTVSGDWQLGLPLVSWRYRLKEAAMTETRRKFDQDFKEGAVRLVRETGKSIAQIAKDLGIHDGTLGNWVARDRAAREGGNGRLGENERAELARLRKENAELAMERDVLKRSVALWVKDAMGR